MHSPLSNILRAALVAAPFAVPVPAESADLFHAGDLVLSVYGNGANTGHYEHNRAAPIVLREITTTGAFVGQLMLPQSGFRNSAGEVNFPISGEYGSSSEGTLQRSADGHLLAIMGYGVAATEFNDASIDRNNAYGTQALAQTSSLKGGSAIAVPRVVATVTAQGEVDTRTALFDFADTNNPRSVATVDGSAFYVAGQGHKRDATQGVQYVRAGASSGVVLFHGTDVRIATIDAGKLYVSTDTRQGGTPEAPGTANIAVYGEGLPTASVTPAILPGLSDQVAVAAGRGNGIDTTGRVNLSPESFFFADASTLYVADSGQPKRHGLGDGGLQKWSLVGGTWQLDYTLSKGLDLQPNTAHTGTAGLIGLTGRVVGGRVELFATTASLDDTGQTFVVGITDSLSANRLPADEAFQVLAASAPDTVIRGIAFAPLPR
jgi:hypothetical protein